MAVTAVFFLRSIFYWYNLYVYVWRKEDIRRKSTNSSPLIKGDLELHVQDGHSSHPAGHRVQLNSSSSDFWQPVDDGPTAYVFSAYLDRRGFESNIKVMAISTNAARQQSTFWCHIFYTILDRTGNATEEAAISLEAKSDTIPRGHAKRFKSNIISCKLPPESKFVPPQWLSISLSNDSRSFKNKLHLHNREYQSPLHNYSVCVGPRHGHYGDFADQFVELLEFIEITSMFGASKLTFYNVSTGHSVSRLFQHYQSAGVVDVVDWKLPVQVDDGQVDDGRGESSEIHYFGQVIALNDCLYRNMFRSRYIAFIDTDEFIVPLVHPDWESMIRNLSSSTDYDIGAYLFPNVFFPKEWSPDAEAGSLPQFKGHTPRTLTFTKREAKVWRHGSRSKCIVVPEKINTVGIHFIFSFQSGREFQVSARDGLLCHYRNRQNFTETTAFEVDRRMYDFKEEIMRRISSSEIKL